MVYSRFFSTVLVLSCSAFAQQPSSEIIGGSDSAQSPSGAAVENGSIARPENHSQSTTVEVLSKEEKSSQHDSYAAMARHGHGLRVGGACLIASSAIWVVGGAMIAVSAPEQTTTTENGYYSQTSTTQDQSQVVLGLVIGSVGGAASLIAGIAMVVTGHIKQHIGESNLNDASLYLKPTPGGMALVINF